MVVTWEQIKLPRSEFIGYSLHVGLSSEQSSSGSAEKWSNQWWHIHVGLSKMAIYLIWYFILLYKYLKIRVNGFSLLFTDIYSTLSYLLNACKYPVNKWQRHMVIQSNFNVKYIYLHLPAQNMHPLNVIVTTFNFTIWINLSDINLDSNLLLKRCCHSLL